MIAVALDDEPIALDIIASYAAQCVFIQKIECFTQVEAAKKFLESNSVDLLFLDIQMPAINGIDFYKNLHKKPLVIFSTSYTQYALQGFDLAATDYLLKPFTYERFYQAVEKAYKQVQATTLVETYIEIKENGFQHSIPIKSIVYIEALDNYIKVFTADRKPIVSRTTLKQMELQLPTTLFVKIHRSYIVSIQHIHAYKTGTVLVAEQLLPVSKSAEKNIAALLALRT